jgi:hypothetical protein
VQHGGDDPGGAVGGRGDDAPARRVLLVDRQRVQRHPVHGVQRILAVALAGELPVQPRRAALHLQPAGQDPGAELPHSRRAHPTIAVAIRRAAAETSRRLGWVVR